MTQIEVAQLAISAEVVLLFALQEVLRIDQVEVDALHFLIK